MDECERTVKRVFESLNEGERNCFITFDEIHIKPGLYYQGRYVLGDALNQNSLCPATTMLALMVNPFFGAPAFIGRLIPVHNLCSEFLYEQLVQLLHCIHNNGGLVYAMMSDNLRVNQKVFKSFHQNFTSLNIYSVTHTIPNQKFQALYTLYDPMHLFKNIRNNWLTEKTQTLDFFIPSTDNIARASWKDLISIYRSQAEESDLKLTKLDQQTLFPNNFEKQKVHLVVNVFNEKTCVALAQMQMEGTKIFVENVTKMWNILNIKKPYAGQKLNDKDREPFKNSSDARLKFLEDMGTSFKKMDNSVFGNRIRGLTSDTSNALHQTLNASLIRNLLHCPDVQLCNDGYVLPGKLQSDRLEAEFGIIRDSSGSNFLIHAEQAINSLQLQQLKLFAKHKVPFQDNLDLNPCCPNLNLHDSEKNLLKNALKNLTELDKSCLSYISGYVARMEKIECPSNAMMELPESEFTKQLSRGKLTLPPHDLYDLSLYLYTFFKNRDVKCCTFLQAFNEIYHFTGCQFPNKIRILRRYTNCFLNLL